MYVFPGGGVDPRDFDAEIGWAGPTPAEWADWLARRRGARAGAGVRRGAGDLRGVRRAARRGRPRTPWSQDTTGEDWEADRRRPGGPGAVLHRRSWTVAASCCAPTCCGCGLTGSRPSSSRGGSTPGSSSPSCRPARCTRDVVGEADHVVWLPVRGGDRAASTSGEMLMLPPTYCTLPGDLRLRDPGGRAGRRRPAGTVTSVRAAGRASTTTAPTCRSRTGWCGSARTSRPDAASEPGAWHGGTFGERAPLRARPEPDHDDPGRHEHLGAPRAGVRPVRGRRPGAGRWRAPRRRRRRTPARSPSCCSPTATPTTPRRPARSPSGSAAASGPWTRAPARRRRASPTATWSRSTGSRSTSSARPATPRTRCRSCCPRSARC